MRVLTEEDITRFGDIANRQANDLQQTTEGHFKQEDIDAIYVEAGKAMLKEQDSRTLKIVGEWLLTKFRKGWQPHGRRIEDKPEVFDLTFFEFELEAFKRGEMPEEVKG